MEEPDDLTLVMVGNPKEDAPWDVEVYVRNDAKAKGSTARWYLTGTGVNGSNYRRASWNWLMESCSPLAILAPQAIR